MYKEKQHIVQFFLVHCLAPLTTILEDHYMIPLNHRTPKQEPSILQTMIFYM